MLKRALAAAALLALSAGSAYADDTKTGTETVTLAYFAALQPNATPVPEKDAACKAKFSSFVGQKVSTEYSINPKTLIMYATSTIEGTTVKMFPLGLSTSYAFMSDGVPEALKAKAVDRVIYSMDTSFGNPYSQLLLLMDAETNCVVSSTPLGMMAK